MSADTIPSVSPHVPRDVIIRAELSSVRKNRDEMMAGNGPYGTHIVVLLACILTNVVFFLTRNDYFAVFIAASFYLNMYYFITLLIPTSFKKNTGGTADISRFGGWLKENGITSGTLQFTRLFINSLLINSRALAPGIGFIFSIDILFVLISYSAGLPFMTMLIVVAQCAAIVIFYLLVWKVEPFSTTYMEKIERAKNQLHRKKVPPMLVTNLFIFGFLLAIFLFLTTIILLPGMTLNTFLTASRLTDLGHLFALILLLAFSQYFIIRYIHGISSRAMADRLFDFKEVSLSRLLDAENENTLPDAGTDESPVESGAELLESKIYSVRKHTLLGAFPVFVVDLDFSVMMDSSTLIVVRGYIEDTKK